MMTTLFRHRVFNQVQSRRYFGEEFVYELQLWWSAMHDEERLRLKLPFLDVPHRPTYVSRAIPKIVYS